MNIVRLLFLGLALCLGVVIIPWLILFYDSGGLSTSTNDWADFGGYVGGTLSSLVAALALIALLHTISQQNHQISILKQQASKEDILHSIDRIERDLDRILEGITIEVAFEDGLQSITARDILYKPSALKFQKAIITEKEFLENLDDPEFHSRIALYEAFGLAAGELNQLRLYVDNLKKLESQAGTSIIARYYFRKHKLAHSRLHGRGQLKDKWEYES